MDFPSPPTGYDVSKPVQAGESVCHITVGFDRVRSRIPRFLVTLHYQSAVDPVEWESVARMDHNETATAGHDVYMEGLHVDVDRRSSDEVQLKLAHGSLPPNRGVVVRGCVEYFRREQDYFIDVYEERTVPGGPPTWSDGGEGTRNFMRAKTVREDMNRETPDQDSLSPDELTALLADATGTTADEIDQRASAIEIAAPEESTVVER